LHTYFHKISFALLLRFNSQFHLEKNNVFEVSFFSTPPRKKHKKLIDLDHINIKIGNKRERGIDDKLTTSST